jgi:hypothetical protein
MGFDNNESVAYELVMFTDNDRDLYRQQMEPIFKNLITKMASGKYDREKAIKLFMYLAESAAKKYAHDAGPGDTSRWHEMFPVPVRKLAATHWRDSFEVEAKLGNYDNLLPKKYQTNEIKAVLSAAGYDSRIEDDSVVLYLSDPGEDEADADAALAEIVALFPARSVTVDWTGGGNTDSDGYNTSDVRVSPAVDY